MAAASSHTVNWPDLRKAYVEREIKPTLQELAEEFGSTAARISTVATDESWLIARATRMEKRLAEAETGSLILAALSGDRTIIDAARTASLNTLRELAELAANVDRSKANSTRADVLNNIAFGISNICNALQKIGITGAKAIDTALKEDNGRWNPQMLSQINLTVQNLVSQAGSREAIP